MEKNITIAVIVPIYNTKDYLNECIDSLTDQSKPFNEIILVDDGSEDGSRLICEKYYREYGNVSFYSIEHQKQGAARNYGINKLTSQYVMFVDSDDYIEKDTVKYLTNILQEHDYDALYYDAETIQDANEVIKFKYDREVDETYKTLTGTALFDYFYPNSYFASSCMNIFRVSLLVSKDIRYPEGCFYEDNYMTFVYLMESSKTGYKKKKIYKRRMRSQSTMTSKLTVEKCEDYLFVIEKMYSYMEMNLRVFSPQIRQYIGDLLYEALKLIMQVEECCEILYKKMKTVWNMYQKICKKINGNIKKWNLGVLLRYYMNYQIINKFTNIDGKYFACEEIKRLLQQKYREIIENIPIKNPAIRIGIYGTGKHTTGLMYFIKTILGDIKSDLYFFESDIVEKKAFCVNKIDDILKYDIDYLIVSSFIYRNPMLNKIDSIGGQFKIIDFYEKVYCDLFSNDEFKYLLQ